MTNLPADTSIADITLVVSDLDGMTAFYTRGMGFERLRAEEKSASFGSDDGAVLLTLVEDRSASPRPTRAPGLFHVAYLYESRPSLARVFRRLLDQGVPFQGAADHGVSEALYLSDPEGNGIELSADRPRDQWPLANGVLEMITAPLDHQGLLAESASGNVPQERARIGHIHLQVGSLGEAEEFWVRKAGFEVMQRSYPGALFVSAGGYHHHVGLNTWRSDGTSLPRGTWTGLRSVTVDIPEDRALFSLRGRFQQDPRSTKFEQTEICFKNNSLSVSSTPSTKGVQ